MRGVEYCLSVCACLCVRTCARAHTPRVCALSLHCPSGGTRSPLSALVDEKECSHTGNKNTYWRAAQGYLPFISQPVTVVVHGQVHLCDSLLSNTLWPFILAPRVIAVEARAVCLRDKADFCSSFLDRETTGDTDNAHQAGF